MTAEDRALLDRIAELDTASEQDIALAIPAIARAVVREEQDRELLAQVTRDQAR